MKHCVQHSWNVAAQLDISRTFRTVHARLQGKGCWTTMTVWASCKLWRNRPVCSFCNASAR